METKKNTTNTKESTEQRIELPVSLRDYFAGQVIGCVDFTKLIDQAIELERIKEYPYPDFTDEDLSKIKALTLDNLANDAYQIADAMLKQREKETT